MLEHLATLNSPGTRSCQGEQGQPVLLSLPAPAPWKISAKLFQNPRDRFLLELSGWHKLQPPYFYVSLYLKGTYERNLMLAGSETHKRSVNKLDPERFPCSFLKHQENSSSG